MEGLIAGEKGVIKSGWGCVDKKLNIKAIEIMKLNLGFMDTTSVLQN